MLAFVLKVKDIVIFNLHWPWCRFPLYLSTAFYGLCQSFGMEQSNMGRLAEKKVRTDG